MNSDKKFIETIPVNEYEVWTDTGWVSIEGSHKTIPYVVYELKTESHTLCCADNHMVYDNRGYLRLVSELTLNDIVVTDTGLERVLSVEKKDRIENMYDLQLPVDSCRRYYMDGILSSNTTIMTIYALWTTLFSSDKTVLIVANKEATAIEILRRIRMAYEQLPNWLKPGIKEWGKTAVVFANDSRIIISSTSSSSSRGQTANCITAESIINVMRDGVDLGYYTIEAFMEEFESDFDFEQEPNNSMVFKFKSGVDFKIKSITGFETFRGIRMSTSCSLVTLKTKNGLELICTHDHLVFKTQTQSIRASELCVGDVIITEFGDDVVSSICDVTDEEIIYDLIGVENGNSFYASGFLVHNCLIVDECLRGDQMVTIRNKDTGEVRSVCIADLMGNDYI